MPITLASIVEDYTERGLSLDESGHYSGKRAWEIELEIPGDVTQEEMDGIEKVVESFVPVVRWSEHPANRRCTARTMGIQTNGSQHRWRAVVDYSSAPLAARADVAGVNSTPQNPAAPNGQNVNDSQTSAQLRLPTVSVSWREYQEVFEKDLQNNPVVNAAGDPFEPPILVNRRAAVYTVKFFRLPWQLDWANRSLLIDALNSAAYSIRGRVYAAGRLKIEDVSFSDVWDTYDLPNNAGKITTLFHEITYVFADNPKGWDIEVMNLGRRELVPAETQPPGVPALPQRKRVILDSAGQPVQDPVPLSALGRELQPPAMPNYLNFPAYGRINFTDIFY